MPGMSSLAGARAGRPLGLPGQRTLLMAVGLVGLGSFLPWIQLAVGVSVSGMQGAGLWTFYAAVLGLAGALVRRRGAAAAQAAILGVAAVGLPAWQVARLLTLGGGWAPGVGLVLVAGGGIVALRAGWRLATAR